jgi:pilus assembly protein Flp/PilA
MTTSFKVFAKDESGATAIEYGLIAALVAVAAIVGMQALGTQLNAIFNTVADELEDAQAAPAPAP